MSKGSKQQSTVVSGELPEYVQPYLEDLLATGLGTVDPETGERLTEGVIGTDYTPYGNVDPETGEFIFAQRIAEPSDLTQYYEQQVKDLYTLGSPYYAESMDKARELYTGMTGDQAFTADVAEQYMSPFMSSVIEGQKEAARSEAATAQEARDFQQARAGALGGSRGALENYLAEQALQGQLQGIEATGRQQAYENAQAQYERDRAAKLAASQAGLGTLESLIGMGRGATQTAYDQLAQLGKVGRTQEERRQADLDLAYQQFLEARDYPLTRLEQASALIRGLPLPTTSTSYAPDTTMRDLLGLGISAYGAYQYGKD